MYYFKDEIVEILVLPTKSLFWSQNNCLFKNCVFKFGNVVSLTHFKTAVLSH